MNAEALPATAVRVSRGRVSGSLAAPGSKSVTNRLLILAALAEGESLLRRPLDSDDSRAMRGVIEGLGAAVSDTAEGWLVQGTGGILQPKAAALDAQLSGTTMRFGMAIAALSGQPVTLTGQTPLLRRPVGALSEALRELGATVDDQGGLPPVQVSGGLRGGAVSVDVSASSQYASALLLAAPYATDDVHLTVVGDSAESYIDLTAAEMSRWGAKVVRDGQTWIVTAGQGYQARVQDVEYDASAAAHLFTMAAASGGHVTVTNVAADTRQADADFPALLAAWGCGVSWDDDATSLAVTGPVATAGDLVVDLASMPDQLPCAAVLAVLRPGVTELRGAEVVRGHETDRIAALATELTRLGVEVSEFPDGLRITGGAPNLSQPVHLQTYDDHRLAMAFAALATAVDGIVIEEPWCVRKTYPSFWTDLQRLGVTWHEAGDA